MNVLLHWNIFYVSFFLGKTVMLNCYYHLSLSLSLHNDFTIEVEYQGTLMFIFVWIL